MSTWHTIVSLEPRVIGWDLGGAHLKLAVLDCTGGLLHVAQFATPLWQGVACLEAVLCQVGRHLPLAACDHFVTMTGELVDLFDDRAQGVGVLAELMAAALPSGRTWLYAGPGGFIAPQEARARYRLVASANWHATAAWLAGKLSRGLLVDIGSTTSDLLPFAGGAVVNTGYSDRERLASEEMVYSGVVRTPVMAVVQQVPFDGAWLRLSNECFATMADTYRILGWLPRQADLHPTTDGRDRSAAASMRRLARMLGADMTDADPAAWRALAAFIADRQLDTLALACQRRFSQMRDGEAPLVGAGVGRFLVRRLARRLEREYVDIDSQLGSAPAGGVDAAVCAPAVAVAQLAVTEVLACAC